ncbi:MAG: helicase-related protein [Candidatus Aenigmatarchaeota archaeon]
MKMEVEELKVGTIIRGKRWKEPIEIKKIDKLEDYIHIVGSTIHSGTHIDQLIPLNEINNLTLEKIESDFLSKPHKVFLAFEGKRYRYASLYDPLLALNVSKVDPLPHQIEAVYGYILKLPRIRFLIADDPGAGKTIMAGLIVKELKLRNLIRRILIVVPGHLKDQWRREMKERFEESFVVMDRGFVDAHYGENVWEKESQIITSIDFAKQDEILPSVIAAHFDLVIVDEAHKMSAYIYGEKTQRTRRYRLGEILSRNSDNLLFLTATPHKGDPENFRLFIDLLEPGFFATSEMLQQSIENKDNPLFIRRIKEDLKDFNGEPLFLPRYIKTLKFNLSEKEKYLYNEVSKYVNEQYNKALAKEKKRNIAFALVILQRRLASSTYALLNSLERRKAKLEELEKIADTKIKFESKVFDFEQIEDLSEEDRWKEEELWETLSVAENKEELRKEIETLKHLIEKAKIIVKEESEVKLKELKKTLDGLNKKYPNKKVIVFTESRDTLEYLEKRVRQWGYTTVIIHGGMRLDQRIEAEKIFKTEKQILVATEAAGEGINLQFCNLMINYDIPWNPNRLEQRMGRIHRYGQQNEVFVFNLVAQDTREGEVLSRIFDKLEEIRDSLGSDKVFDVIGEVFFGKNLQQILIEAAAGAKSREEILKEIDIKVDEAYIEKVKENLGESLASRYIDYTRIKEMSEKAREYKLIPEYTEAFFKKAFLLGGGKFKIRKDGFTTIDSIPYDIRVIAEEDYFRRKFGSLLKTYPKITFDKDIAFKNPDAELVSFGHPLFEAVLEYVERTYSNDLKKGALFIDPEGRLDGYIVFYEGEIKDGLNKIVGKRLFSTYVNQNEVRSVAPTILWDLAEGKSQKEQINIQPTEQRVVSKVISEMENYKKQKLDERQREAKIKEKYGIKSLEYFLVKLDGELIELHSRKERGENVDLAIRNKEEQLKKYQKALEELRDQIEREQTLTMGMPKFIGIIRVKPAETVSDYMKSDEEIERIGMEEAMKYERVHNRNPEDVSVENLGFDIRSHDNDGKIRYIEVKARADVGSVVLTQNEWFKAQRFGDEYYLYVVFNCATKPELLIIQNPAQKLKPEEKIEIVRYLVSLEQIKEKSEKNAR